MKIVDGKVFYQIKIEHSETIRNELIDFLKSRGFPNSEVNKLDFDFKASEGKSVSLDSKDVKLTLKIGIDVLVLLFETNKDSTEMSEYLGKNFE